MDQLEVSSSWLRNFRRLQYANFVLQAKNAADEAVTGVCKPDVVAPEIHRNSLHELKLWTFKSPRKKFAWWAVIWRTHKPQNCQNWGVGPCLGMGTIRYMQIIELVYCFTQSLPKLVILKWCCKASDSCGGRHRTWYLRLIIHADDCLQSTFLKVFLSIVHWDWLTIYRVPTNIVGLLVCFLGCFFFFFFSRPTAKPLKHFSTWLQVQCPSLQKQKIH